MLHKLAVNRGRASNGKDIRWEVLRLRREDVIFGRGYLVGGHGIGTRSPACNVLRLAYSGLFAVARIVRFCITANKAKKPAVVRN